MLRLEIIKLHDLSGSQALEILDKEILLYEDETQNDNINTLVKVQGGEYRYSWIDEDDQPQTVFFSRQYVYPLIRLVESKKWYRFIYVTVSADETKHRFAPKAGELKGMQLQLLDDDNPQKRKQNERFKELFKEVSDSNPESLMEFFIRLAAIQKIDPNDL